MPVVGGEDKYRTTLILSTDCQVLRVLCRWCFEPNGDQGFWHPRLHQWVHMWKRSYNPYIYAVIYEAQTRVQVLYPVPVRDTGMANLKKLRHGYGEGHV
ncbi:hypothetical protein LguiA_013389 [Lonicera macranthoides]